ncbi:hypothetical protein MIMGU_mgv11b023134mg [Erythranthe guttata]|uniref:Secreted protein n=1 Tax=Erythranthe guttata TaxID=4155 RepID=A0A022QYF8_ERYGU|nr:hypothetical protein MIMGU_mgv11b023134mg [Erythranthe guttata]
MRINVLVLYFVFLRTLLRMHFCACFFTCTFVHVHLSECVCAELCWECTFAHGFLHCTFVHVHLSKCVCCACLLICINVLGL